MEEMEILRDEADKEQFDASVIIGKKPGRYYRWARNDDRNLILRRMDGYEICTDPDVKSALNAASRLKKGQDTDGTVTFGDLILMETSQENHDRLMEMERRKIVRRTHGVMESYKHNIRRAAQGEDLAFEDHGKRPDAEGKGYGKGYTEEDMKKELESSPMNEGRSWRGRRE